MAPNQLQFIKNVLYQLKQRYGAPIEYYQVTSTVIDDDTGVTTVVKSKTVIRKAIRLPDRRTRGFDYDLSYIAANKNFTMGGTFDRSQREFIIDRKSVSRDFEPAVDDYLLLERTRYNVKEVIELDYRQGYFIIAQSTESEPPSAIIERSISNSIILDSEVSHVLN